MMQVVSSVISENQHGFITGRSIQTCSLPVLEALQDAERTGNPMQIISVDIQGAFNAICPDVIKQVMEKTGFPDNLVTAMHDLTCTGTARVYANGEAGQEFITRTGKGQGDPPSAGRYNIGADPSLRALQNQTEEVRYVLTNGQKVPPVGYADDIMVCIRARRIQDILNIIQVFQDYTKVSGLRINLQKSEV